LDTGGACFIGSNIVERLVKNGENVRIIDNFSTGKRENIAPFADKIELIEGDIRSYHIVMDAMKDVDYVFHEAALPSVPKSIKDPLTTNEVNIVGTLNLLQAAKNSRVKRFVFASSSIFGDSETSPKVETLPPNPKSPYSISKLAGEEYCKAFYDLYRLPAISLRYFNVFGPRQDPNSQYSAVIPKFIKSIKNGKHITVFVDGNQKRDFTYIDNVVNATQLLFITFFLKCLIFVNITVLLNN
jgi:UDP-glucose 4-epimerase